MFNNVFVENLDVYKTMWENNVERGRLQMAIWHICIECWVPTSTNTRSEYVIFIAFTLQQYLHERA
jgi:hypothetical protein